MVTDGARPVERGDGKGWVAILAFDVIWGRRLRWMNGKMIAGGLGAGRD